MYSNTLDYIFVKFNLNPSFRMQLKGVNTPLYSTSFKSPQFTKMPGTGGTGAYGDVSDGIRQLVPYFYTKRIIASKQWQCNYQVNMPIFCYCCQWSIHRISDDAQVANFVYLKKCRETGDYIGVKRYAQGCGKNGTVLNGNLRAGAEDVGIGTKGSALAYPYIAATRDSPPLKFGENVSDEIVLEFLKNNELGIELAEYVHFP